MQIVTMGIESYPSRVFLFNDQDSPPKANAESVLV